MNQEQSKEEYQEQLKSIDTAFLRDLVGKAEVVNQKTEKYANCHFTIDDEDFPVTVPIRVDDHQLLYIGAALLPNILNYLVNILPQFIYPYVVAYLQDMSKDSENPVNITELFDLIKSLNEPE